MSGAQHAKFYKGHSAEGLAEFILGTMAFVTKVERPVDIGHDFQCVLFSETGGMLLGGPPFSVQVKSRRTTVRYSKPHALTWLKHQRSPFFICVADLRRLQVDLYTTWMLLHAAIDVESSGIDLVPGVLDGECAPVAMEGKPPRHVVPLGRPILRISAADAANRDKAAGYAAILRQWIQLDWVNIHERFSSMFWPLGPKEWETNKPLPEVYAAHARFFSNQQNIPNIRRNLLRSAVALRVDLSRVAVDRPEDARALRDETRVLDLMIRAYSPALAPSVRQVIKNFGLGSIVGDAARKAP